ncbi:MAG: FAD-dependent oxidoreductase [Gemmatimonadota bacterium]|nr:FAD-dependent oxidoreductase [Gemmatimonadota bacterium]
MSEETTSLSGPDLEAGIPAATLGDGALLVGHARGKSVLLARNGDDIFAVAASCTHYGGPLGEGILVGDTVRCPWHHACFSLRTGEAIRAPALNPIARWKVERRGDMIVVTDEIPAVDGATRAPRDARATGSASTQSSPASIIIVGAGAAGNAAAEMLRREGYDGAITMVGADASVPYDRPNLSKDYLSGAAPEEWIPLRPASFYQDHHIELLTSTSATKIDPKETRITLDTGASLVFDRLLIATGADPILLPVPGAGLAHVHYLRTLADSRSIIAAAATARRAVVIGASFIGLEVAASLRTRGLEVDVVAPEAQPLVKILGPELGAFVRSVHEEHGVTFHLQRAATHIAADTVTLDSGEVLSADLVVIGIGVRPSLALAEQAGIAMDRGITVDTYLETSVPGIFAAGDIARYPDVYSGERIRVEHWVVAERQGQTAARNMLGNREPYALLPFFWSAHYDTAVSYVGHAEQWDEMIVDGDLSKREAAVAFRTRGRTLAVATVGRDRVLLEAELAMERRDATRLDALVKRVQKAQ